MAVVPWQMRVNGQWHDFDATTSSLMELAFGVHTTNQLKQVPFPSSTSSIKADFDLKTMTFGDLPVRRSKGDPPEGTVEYWDDVSYVQCDKFITNLVVDAIKIGRSSVAFFVGDELYTIDLSQGLKRMCQCNTSTGRTRPLFVEMPPAVYGQDDVDELVISANVEESKVPPEFLCPITMAIMTMPVVAADGNTYDKKAIMRWMAKKRVSPVSSVPLANSDLTLNRALRKLISDNCCDTEPASDKKDASDSDNLKRKKTHKASSEDEEAEEGDDEEEDCGASLLAYATTVTRFQQAGAPLEMATATADGGINSSVDKKALKKRKLPVHSKSTTPVAGLCTMCDKHSVAHEHMKDANTFVTCGECGVMMHVQCFLDNVSLRAMALFKHQARIICSSCSSE